MSACPPNATELPRYGNGRFGPYAPQQKPDLFNHLVGAPAPLFKGLDGVRTYFLHLPPGLKAQMGEQSVVAVEPNVLLSSGLVQFTTKDGVVVPFRLTLALVKVGGQWLIAQHHASPVPKT